MKLLFGYVWTERRLILRLYSKVGNVSPEVCNLVQFQTGEVFGLVEQEMQGRILLECWRMLRRDCRESTTSLLLRHFEPRCDWGAWKRRKTKNFWIFDEVNTTNVNFQNFCNNKNLYYKVAWLLTTFIVQPKWILLYQVNQNSLGSSLYTRQSNYES